MNACIVRIGLAFSAIAAAFVSARAQTCATEQVVGPGGTPANNHSYTPRVNADGRYVAFESFATVFVPGLPIPQAYLLDRQTGAFELLSQSSSGAASTYATPTPHAQPSGISADGRFVTFVSNANNLLTSDTNQGSDVLIRDRVLGTTDTVNRMPDGTTGVSGSGGGSMSTDGRKIVFVTNNILDPADLNGFLDVYVYDRISATTTLVSRSYTGGISDTGATSADISADGRFVAFVSRSNNIVPGDTNLIEDVFVRDLATGTNERISVGIAGAQPDQSCGDGSISGDGRFVAFSSSSSNLVPGNAGGWVDTFVRDRALGLTLQVNLTPAGLDSQGANTRPDDISGDGRYVVFSTASDDLLPGDNNGKDDVFVRDLWTSTTRLVSALPNGGFPGAASGGPGAISADGRVIAFASQASNLNQPPIPNGYQDIFVRECTPNGPSVYCIAQVTSNGCVPAIGANGSASASSGSGFDVAATSMLNNKFGTLFYGTQGSNLVPFIGGWLCVRAPFRRTGLQYSNGNAPPDDCSGAFHFDFNTWIASGADPSLVAGTEVWCQYWSRDGAAEFQTNLSDALYFSIGP